MLWSHYFCKIRRSSAKNLCANESNSSRKKCAFLKYYQLRLDSSASYLCFHSLVCSFCPMPPVTLVTSNSSASRKLLSSLSFLKHRIHCHEVIFLFCCNCFQLFLMVICRLLSSISSCSFKQALKCRLANDTFLQRLSVIGNVWQNWLSAVRSTLTHCVDPKQMSRDSDILFLWPLHHLTENSTTVYFPWPAMKFSAYMV